MILCIKVAVYYEQYNVFYSAIYNVAFTSNKIFKIQNLIRILKIIYFSEKFIQFYHLFSVMSKL